jgi:peptide/nickel transport system permease protein
MREGSRTDRTLSTVAITTTATPEYVSGVIFIAVFSSSAFGLKVVQRIGRNGDGKSNV